MVGAQKRFLPLQFKWSWMPLNARTLLVYALIKIWIPFGWTFIKSETRLRQFRNRVFSALNSNGPEFRSTPARNNNADRRLRFCVLRHIRENILLPCRVVFFDRHLPVQRCSQPFYIQVPHTYFKIVHIPLDDLITCFFLLVN